MPEKQYYDIDGKPIQKQYFDYEGKPISLEGSAQEGKLVSGQKSELRQAEPVADFIRSNIGPLITPTLSGLGAAGGGILGAISPAPGGAAIGGASGYAGGHYLGELLKSYLPKYLGQPEEGSLDTLATGFKQGAINEAIPGAANVAAKLTTGIQGGTKQAIFNRIITSTHPEDIAAREAFKQFPEFQPTAAQLKPTSKVLQYLEEVAPASKAARVQTQKEFATTKANEIGGFKSPTELAQQQQTSLIKGRQKISKFQSGAYQPSELVASANTEQVVTGYEPVIPVVPKDNTVASFVAAKAQTLPPKPIYANVVGPIYLDEAVNKAYKFLDEKNLLTQNGTIDVPKLAASKYAKLSDTFDSLLSTITKDSKGNLLKNADGSFQIKPVDYKLAREIKAATGGEGGYGQAQITGQEREFMGVTRSLDKGIKTSIAKWKVDPEIALKSYESGNAITGVKAKLFYDDPVKAFVENIDSGVDVQRAIIKDPIKIQRVLAAGGNRASLKGEAVSELVDKAFDKASNKVDGAAALDLWHSRDMADSYKVLFNAKDKANLENFFTAVKSVSQPTPGGKVGMTIAIGRNAFFLGSSVALGKVSAGTGAAAGIVGVAIGLNRFANRILLNPDLARLATNSLKIPANTSQAVFNTRAMLRGLSGEIVDATFSDGSTGKAEIQDGKLVPLPKSP